MNEEALADFLRAHLDGAEFTPAMLAPILQGGSDRRFFRCPVRGGSVVVVVYGTERSENASYAACADFLRQHGVRVPEVVAHDPVRRVLILEDLGSADLWSQRAEPWELRRAGYQAALREVAALHRVPVEEAARRGLLQKEFDEALYLWEQGYFCEHFLRGVVGWSPDQAARWEGHPALRRMASDLAALPRSLVHRDFQSQNVLCRDGAAWLIDFQGMRPGRPEYDLASLLYDPYVPMTGSQRAELLDYYRRLGPEPPAGVDPALLLRHCAIQRLMQALGAYGFLGRMRGKPEFLRHVPVAAERLAALLAEDPDLQPLAADLQEQTGTV